MEKPFEYNDEFFLKQDARDRAKAEFSKIWFALHSQVIVDTFDRIDEEAKTLKRRFQLWGFRVVAMAVFALAMAAIDSAFIHPAVEAHKLPHATSKIVGYVAGGAGIVSFLMGYFGMGFAGRKRKWLETRLMCERIRQWRWQYFCAHLPEAIQASGNAAKEEQYQTERDQRFLAYVDSMRQLEFEAVKQILSAKADAPSAAWIRTGIPQDIERDDLAGALEDVDKATAAGQANAAFANVRVGGQERYANYLVRDVGPFTTHPATQLHHLHQMGTRLVFLILILHIGVVIWALGVSSLEKVLPVMHVLAVICALAALGLRAVEDGLRPAEHLGRFKGYLAEVSSIGDAFKKARNGAERRNQMLALEKAAYKEMVDFIRTGDRSKYVM